MTAAIRRLGFGVGMLTVPFIVQATAFAALPKAVSLEVRGSCPTLAQVRGTLSLLLPRTRLLPHTAEASTPEPTPHVIVDSEAGLTVSIGSEVRVFSPIPTSCEERARLAAVFIHLTFEPLVLIEAPHQQDVSPPDRTPQDAPPQQLAPEATTAPSRLRYHVVAQAVAPLGSSTLSAQLDWGVAARVWSGTPWGITAGVGWATARRRKLTPEAEELAALPLHLRRVPLDVALRWTHAANGWATYAELGPELALLWVSAQRLDNADENIRLEVAARSAVGFSLRVDDTLSAIVGASLSYVPEPYELRVDRHAGWGSSPRLWLSITGGFLL